LKKKKEKRWKTEKDWVTKSLVVGGIML